VPNHNRFVQAKTEQAETMNMPPHSTQGLCLFRRLVLI